MKRHYPLVLTLGLVAANLTSLATAQYWESPFGFHPASITVGGYPRSPFWDAEQIGIRWHRPPLYAFWFIVQPDTADTTLFFGKYDTLYGQVPQGIRILANITVLPGRYSLPDSNNWRIPGTYLPSDSAKYVRFVQAAVSRYAAFPNPVLYWQIDNEPSVLRRGEFPRFVRMTYAAIKQARPDAQVLIGGATGFPEDFISNFRPQYLPILESLNGYGFDIMDFHWYGHAFGHYRQARIAYDTVRAALDRNGFQNIPIWITEMGSYSDTISWSPPYPRQSDTLQARDYFKRFIYPLSFGVKKIFPAFGLIEGFKQNDGYFDHTGLIYDGLGMGDRGFGVRKHGWYMYQRMTQQLEGATWDSLRALPTGLDSVYAYRLLRQNVPLYIAWWDYFAKLYPEDSVVLTLGGISSAKVAVSPVIPYDTTGGQGRFRSDTLAASGGSVNVVLRRDPVIVQELPGTEVNSLGFPSFSIPYALQLKNRSNPFSRTTTISFDLPHSEPVALRVYNLAGQTVATLWEGYKEAGSHTLTWDASGLSSGVYFFRLSCNNETVIQKVILTR